jgi:hypothetical protein
VGKKVISFELSEQDIDRAIREVEEYKKDFVRKLDLFRQRVAEELAKEARSGFSGAIVDDIFKGGSRRTAKVEVSCDHRDNISVVIADGEDAIWVEFGAGVYHNGSAGSSSHPKGSELGYTIGGYGKGYGRKKAWGYYNEDKQLVLTHGTPATMPMYNAVKTVCDSIDSIVREVFG